MKSRGINIDHYNVNTSEITSENMDIEKIFFDVKELLPGQLSCPYHYHHGNEEVFLILEGNALLRQGNKIKDVHKGDLIYFKTGPDGAHQLHNNSDSRVLYLDLTTYTGTIPDICEYPDSNKINYGNGNIYIKDKKITYFNGEENIPDFWKNKKDNK